MEYSTPEMVSKEINNLNNGVGLQFEVSGDNIIVKTFQEDELQALSKSKDLYHAICFADRPGASYFYAYLEHTYFPPVSEVNKEYQYRVFKWFEMLYCIGSIPLAKKQLVENTAQVAGMAVQDKAIPFSAGILRASLDPAKITDELNNVVKWFPLNTSTACTLETASADSPIYQAGGVQDLHAEYEFKLKTMYEEKGISWDKVKKRRGE